MKAQIINMFEVMFIFLLDSVIITVEAFQAVQYSVTASTS